MRLLSLIFVFVVTACLPPPPPDVPSQPVPAGFQNPAIKRFTQSKREDEDPAILRTKDGEYVIAWFSKRDGDGDIYIKKSKDGVNWGPPILSLKSSDGDFFPSLIQARDGRFHMTWFRIGKKSHKFRVYYASSRDLKNWTQPQALTEEKGFGWVPKIIEDKRGVLWIVWTSGMTGNRDIFVRASRNQGRSWEQPIQITSTKLSDDFPDIYQRQDGTLVIVWTRCQERRNDSCLNGTAEIVYATSPNGQHWSQPKFLTQDQDIDIFPSVYLHPRTGRDMVIWASSKYGNSLVEAPLGENQSAVPVLAKDGYWSPRVVALPDKRRLVVAVGRYNGDEEIVTFVLP